MADVDKINVNNTSYNICDSIARANIPTKTSDLTNDSGYITSASVPTRTSQLTNDSGFVGVSTTVSGSFVLRAYSNGYKQIESRVVQSLNVTNQFGSLYFVASSITIPSDIGLSGYNSVNLSYEGDNGMFISITSISGNTVSFYVMSPVSITNNTTIINVLITGF